MNAWNRRQPVGGALLVSVALVAAACGSPTETSATETSTVAQTSSTAVPTTVPVTTVAPTTAVPTTAEPEGDSPVELQELGLILTADVTYRTTTEVPFEFSVHETDGFWQLAAQNRWSATFIFRNFNQTSAIGSEAGFNIAVAESGATPESVANAMLESRQDTIGYVRSQGLFKGQDAIILEGVHTEPEYIGEVPVLTGENSNFVVLFDAERLYRSQIFEEQGRVFIVSQDSHPNDLALLLAEMAPVLESMEIGVGT